MNTMHVHMRFCVEPTDLEFECKKLILYKISRQTCALTPTGRCKFLEIFKNAFTRLFVGSSRLIVPILCTLDLPDPNDKGKRDFGAKLGQILTLDVSARGKICKF